MTIPPFASKQVPGIHRYRIGSLEITAISDGFTDFDIQLLDHVDPVKVEAVQRSYFLPTGNTLRGSINCYAINTGEELTLIDAGAGDNFGVTTGLMIENLEAAGFRPEQVGRVVLTHMHPDHIGGLRDQIGRAVFPNASVLVHEAEQAFWTKPENKVDAREDMRPYFDLAIEIYELYRDCVTNFEYGERLCPNVSTYELSGHTPGHTGIQIASGSGSLFILGDLVNAAVLQLANPHWSSALDVDKGAAVATRNRTLAWVADHRMLIAGMHLPFPGVGHLERTGDGYKFVPAPWQFVLD